MSHAVIMVVVEPGDNLEAAVAHQMAPFDENGEWFGDGTRWDWYVIGGRWEGLFGGENYRTAGWLKENWTTDFAVRAVLRERHWNERDRMGWFGGEAATECETGGKPKPRRCVTKVGKDARIVVWNEEWEPWQEAFAKRFIHTIERDDLVCVVVDYHV